MTLDNIPGNQTCVNQTRLMTFSNTLVYVIDTKSIPIVLLSNKLSADIWIKLVHIIKMTGYILIAQSTNMTQMSTTNPIFKSMFLEFSVKPSPG